MTGDLRALDRPYPQAVAGTPRAFGFDTSNGAFNFTYSTTRATGHGRFKPLPRWLIALAALVMLAVLVTPALVVLLRTEPPAEIKPEAGVHVGRVPTDVAVQGSTVWVVSGRDNRVVAIDAGDLRSRPVSRATGAAPLRVAAGDGSIWTADAGDDTVTRLDPLLALRHE